MYWLTLRTFYCFVFVSYVEVRFNIFLIEELIDWLIDVKFTLRSSRPQKHTSFFQLVHAVIYLIRYLAG